MKKYIVSFLIIGTFATYALFQKAGASSTTSPISNSDTPSGITVETPTTNTISSETPSGDTPKTPVSLGNNSQISIPAKTTSTGQYKDGIYPGVSTNAYYGYVQVEAVIQNGKLADVKILDYPNDRGTSIRINSIALPQLVSEAIQVQSANVDTVSGASDSSGAFRKSLASALQTAKNS